MYEVQDDIKVYAYMDYQKQNVLELPTIMTPKKVSDLESSETMQQNKYPNKLCVGVSYSSCKNLKTKNKEGREYGTQLTYIGKRKRILVDFSSQIIKGRKGVKCLVLKINKQTNKKHP